MPAYTVNSTGILCGFALCCLCIWVLFGFIQLPKREREAYAFVRELSKRLSKEAFFHALKQGERQHFAGIHRVWSDAPYLLVVKENEKPIAMIGFSLSRSTLSVVQLQGIRGVNLRGRNVGTLLLPYAELLARMLGKPYVRVQAAYRQTYFDLDEESRLYPKLYEHQERMRQIYDRAPQALGYEPQRWLRSVPWRRKKLRKLVTFPRFLRMHALLFDRSMRALVRSGSAEYLLHE